MPYAPPERVGPTDHSGQRHARPGRKRKGEVRSHSAPLPHETTDPILPRWSSGLQSVGEEVQATKSDPEWKEVRVICVGGNPSSTTPEGQEGRKAIPTKGDFESPPETGVKSNTLFEGYESTRYMVAEAILPSHERSDAWTDLPLVLN